MLRLARLIDVDHVRMVERGLQLRLALEALDELGVVLELGAEHLDRDFATDRQLRGLIDWPPPPRPIRRSRR